jgi:hypothetical protein
MTDVLFWEKHITHNGRDVKVKGGIDEDRIITIKVFNSGRTLVTPSDIDPAIYTKRVSQRLIEVRLYCFRTFNLLYLAWCVTTTLSSKITYIHITNTWSLNCTYGQKG